MMDILVILAHPNKDSFNHAIASCAVEKLEENGHHVIFHDLYAEKFDPMLPASEIPEGAAISSQVETHCREISSADGIIIIHPNWWGQPPAILKGWVDRVFRPGVAYQPVEGEPLAYGLLKAKCAVVFNTSDTPKDREIGQFGDPLETIWKNCIFGFSGVDKFHREMFSVIIISTPEQRHEWLSRVQKSVDYHFPKDSN
jgi:putative NADPH-quinone reductase